MKIEIDSKKITTTLVVAALIGGFSWIWTINSRITALESPEALSTRVKTLEDLIFPIAVEYEVRKRIGANNDNVPKEVPKDLAPIWVPPTNKIKPDPTVINEAEDDVRSRIEQRPLEDARKRRGRPIKRKTKS